MQLRITETIIEEKAENSIVLVSDNKVHILNETAGLIYSIIKDRNPSLQELMLEYRSRYIEESNVSFDEMISDLIEILLRFCDQKIIEIV